MFTVTNVNTIVLKITHKKATVILQVRLEDEGMLRWKREILRISENKGKQPKRKTGTTIFFSKAKPDSK